MIARLLTAGLLLTAGWGATGAHAQEAGICPAPGAGVDTTVRKADLVIRASARAREVRFGSQPRIDVRLTGCSGRDTVRVIERRNLPEPVQPGVTYREVFVAVEILGHLDVECLLPEMGLAPRGAAPDSLRVRGGSVPVPICPPERGDTVPRPPPRR